MKCKNILDITFASEEFKLIEKEIRILRERFIALAMDYKSFIDNSILDLDIYLYRDNIMYRINSSMFHLQLLFNYIEYSNTNIEANLIENNITLMRSGMYEEEVTCLLDSFFFHSISTFDYISSMINYISGSRNKKTLTWTQLVRSVRDEKNKLSETNFSKIVDQIDREFICKLYDHRSSLIHRESDIGGHTVSHDPMNKKTTTIFFAGENLIKCFKPLKELSKENDLSIKYIAVWIMKEVIKRINDLLFALKKEVESKYDGDALTIFYQDPKTKERLPISTGLWHEDLYNE